MRFLCTHASVLNITSFLTYISCARIHYQTLKNVHTEAFKRRCRFCLATIKSSVAKSDVSCLGYKTAEGGSVSLEQPFPSCAYLIIHSCSLSRRVLYWDKNKSCPLARVLFICFYTNYFGSGGLPLGVHAEWYSLEQQGACIHLVRAELCVCTWRRSK